MEGRASARLTVTVARSPAADRDTQRRRAVSARGPAAQAGLSSQSQQRAACQADSDQVQVHPAAAGTVTAAARAGCRRDRAPPRPRQTGPLFTVGGTTGKPGSHSTRAQSQMKMLRRAQNEMFTFEIDAENAIVGCTLGTLGHPVELAS